MNKNTNVLIDTAGMSNRQRMALDEKGFEPLPDELQTAAKKKLAGSRKAVVSRTSGGKLSRWAAGKRKKAKQVAKAIRRSNRHI